MYLANHKKSIIKLAELLAYFVVTLVLYYPTHKAGLIFDFNGWALKYEAGSFKDIWHSFGYPGFHQVEHLFFYSFYKLFGHNGLLWFILFSALHASVGLVGRQLVLKLANTFGNENESYKLQSYLVAVLFLLSPFALDTVVSKVTVHYFVSALLLFSACLFYLNYLKQNNYIHFGLSVLCFTFSLFTLEISYIFPLIVVFLSILYGFKTKIRPKVLSLVIPFVVLIGFLLLHRLLLGTFIGHYGAEVHTRIKFNELVSNLVVYAGNYTVFFDFWTYKYKAKAIANLQKYWVAFLVPLCLFFVYFLYQNINKKRIAQSAFVGLFCLFLAPVINLYVVYLYPIENDRYGYLASVFIYAFLVFFTYKLVNKYVFWGLFFAFLVGNVYFLKQNINNAAIAGNVSYSLLNTFPKTSSKPILILNTPDNANGFRSFRTIDEGSSFAKSYYLVSGKDLRNQIHNVYQMNFTSVQDSIKFEITDTNTINVKIGQWGTWFWHKGHGALPYENHLYRCTTGDLSYTLTLKQPMHKYQILYVANGQWKTVDVDAH